MENINDLSDIELDALLLAQVTPHWQKVAIVVAKTFREYDTWMMSESPNASLH